MSPLNCSFPGIESGQSFFCGISNLPEGADSDGDGVPNNSDNCPAIPNRSQSDIDQDKIGDACDPDVDGDNVRNEVDACPMTNQSTAVDPDNGCSIAQLCPCNGPMDSNLPWPKQSQYLSCVKDWAGDFDNRGIISAAEKKAIISDAKKSNCGN